MRCLGILLFLLDINSYMSQSLLKSGDPRKVIKGSRIMCDKFAENPFFEPEMLIGAPWRIYYSWNLKLDTCLDMKFKKATPMIIERTKSDMSDYLEMQPTWEAAILLMTMGKARHEMLLFADQGSAGNLVGVPNVVRQGDLSPPKFSAPLMQFRFKLINDGKYLIMMDCNLGVVSLSARSKPTPYKADIAKAAGEFNFGEGFIACREDKNKNEGFSGV